MKIEKTETISVQKIVDVKYFCDKCDNQIFYNKFNPYDFSWFEIRHGSASPDGGSGIDTKMHLCEKCSNLAVEILSKNGYKIREEKWEF